jgi:hypothetical protein
LPPSGANLPAIEESLPLIEEQLGASILDACLEVQSAIGRWQDSADDAISTIEPGHGSGDGDLSIDSASAQYDVVEPEYNANSKADTEESRAQGPARRPSPDRYVPKPKYRLVFSTLRRRLGQGPRRRD